MTSQSSSLDELSDLARVAHVDLCRDLASTCLWSHWLGDDGLSSDGEMLCVPRRNAGSGSGCSCPLSCWSESSESVRSLKSRVLASCSWSSRAKISGLAKKLEHLTSRGESCSDPKDRSTPPAAVWASHTSAWRDPPSPGGGSSSSTRSSARRHRRVRPEVLQPQERVACQPPNYSAEFFTRESGFSLYSISLCIYIRHINTENPADTNAYHILKVRLIWNCFDTLRKFSSYVIFKATFVFVFLFLSARWSILMLVFLFQKAKYGQI